MNVTSDNQPLIRSAPENTVNTTDLKSVKDHTKQQKTNKSDTDALSARKSDTVYISKAGAELSRTSSNASGNDSMEPSTDMMLEEKRLSSGGIESVMARYREAQNFLAQIDSGSINSTV